VWFRYPAGAPPEPTLLDVHRPPGVFRWESRPPLGAISFGHAYVAHGWFQSDVLPYPCDGPAGREKRSSNMRPCERYRDSGYSSGQALEGLGALSLWRSVQVPGWARFACCRRKMASQIDIWGDTRARARARASSPSPTPGQAGGQGGGQQGIPHPTSNEGKIGSLHNRNA
jgi:hypothetical protein